MMMTQAKHQHRQDANNAQQALMEHCAAQHDAAEAAINQWMASAAQLKGADLDALDCALDDFAHAFACARVAQSGQRKPFAAARAAIKVVAGRRL
jgi:hypothetical protein